MIIIDVSKEKNIESALKLLKNKVQKTKLVQQLKSRKEFVKRSIEKRNVIQRAIYIQKIKNGL